jgi:dihydroxy-acid dehydratase
MEQPLTNSQTNEQVTGIAETGSDLSPCNRHHLDWLSVSEMGLSLPVEPHSSCLVTPFKGLASDPQQVRSEPVLPLSRLVLFGYLPNSVVLPVDCDKTTPALLMACCNSPHASHYNERWPNAEW